MKKIKKIIFIFFMVLVILSGVITFLVRPELGFYVYDTLSRAFSTASLEALNTDGIVFSSNDDITFNYNDSLMLINSEYPLSDVYVPDIVEYKNSTLFFNTSMVEAYSELSAHISESFDKKLYVMSAYRSEDDQRAAIQAEGQNAAAVGESEHQSGLALDVYISMYAGAGFIKSDVGRYININSWKYGFIIRYPYYAKTETGMGYEPWHIRYVGVPHAEIMYKNSLSLEEYITSLEIGKYYEYGSYIITRQSDVPTETPADAVSALISHDNTGYYIITYERQK